MRITTTQQAEVLNRLTTIANGDIDLVQRAIRASSEHNKPAPLEKVIRYILRERDRPQPHRQAKVA